MKGHQGGKISFVGMPFWKTSAWIIETMFLNKFNADWKRPKYLYKHYNWFSKNNIIIVLELWAKNLRAKTQVCVVLGPDS